MLVAEPAMTLDSPKNTSRAKSKQNFSKAYLHSEIAWAEIGVWLTPHQVCSLLVAMSVKSGSHAIARMTLNLLLNASFLAAGFRDDILGKDIYKLLSLRYLDEPDVRKVVRELLRTIQKNYDSVYLEQFGRRVETDESALRDYLLATMQHRFGDGSFATELILKDRNRKAQLIRCRGSSNLPNHFKDRHSRAVSAIIIAHLSNGQNLTVSGSWDHSIKVWDKTMPFTGKCLASLIGHTSVVCGLLWIPQTPDVVWSSSYDFTVRKWNLMNMTCERVIKFHATVATICTVSIAGELQVVAGVINGDLIVIENGNRHRELCSLSDNITNSCCLDPPTIFAVALETGCVKIIDCRGVIVMELLGHSSWAYLMTPHRVNCDEFHHRIISCSDDTTIRVWKYHEGLCEGVLVGHEFRVLSVTAIQGTKSSDIYIVSCSYDGTVRLWNWTKRIHLSSYTVGQGMRAILTNWETCVYVGTFDGRVLVLDLDI